MHFSSLFVISSIISSSLALPLNSFVSVLDDVRHQVSNLTAQINAFPSIGGTFDQALVAYRLRCVVLLWADLAEYHQHYPMFNEAESRANMKALRKLESTSEASLDAILAKKAAFKDVKGDEDVMAILTEDVKDYASASESFNNGLIARTDVSGMYLSLKFFR
ncbi:hypothetical protein C0992_007120 [Termitomyces sp. T32_za158]|nr:hypothetical protein C0992_007120 [Termitomyces sp. T32_za158]